MGKVRDLIGFKSHNLTVLSFAGMVHNSNGTAASWKCLCTCGAELVLVNNIIVSGLKKSCGCKRKGENSEHYRSPTYKSWSMMKDRCNNTNCPAYEYYGGKGVTYNTRWDNFLNFLKDMGERPEDTSLDRIDPSGNYWKGNCRWATREQQAYNQNLRATNTSGKTGVYECKRNKLPTWISFIEVDGRRKHLGSFRTFELAIEARELAEVKYYGKLKGN
jgi:hypothetical protein